MSVEEGFAEVYVVQWPLTPDAPAALAWVVMKRQGGALLALPTGFLSVADLEEQQDPSHPIGASVVLTVPAVQESEGGFRGRSSFLRGCGDSSGSLCFGGQVKGVGGQLGWRHAGVLLCGRRGRPTKAECDEGHPKEGWRRKGKEGFCSSASGRKHKVLGRVGPRLGSPVDSYPGGTSKDEAGFRSSGCEVISEAESSPRFHGFADAGKSHGSSAQNQEYEPVASSSKEGFLCPEDRHRHADPGAVGRGRSGGSCGGEGGRECIGPCGFGAEPCSHQPGLPDAERGSPPRLPRKQLFNVFKGGPRQGEVASRVELEIRRFHAGNASECPPQDETSQSFTVNSCPGCGERLFNGQLLGTLRRLRKLSRARHHPVCPQLCDRCISQRRPCRCAGACSSSMCGFEASLPGSRSLGPCVPSLAVGRSTVPTLDVQSQQLPGLHRQGKSFRTTLPPTMGNGIVGFPEGVGLHQQPENRDHKESSAKAGGDGCSTEKEEVSKGKRRRRPRRRCSSQQLSSLVEDYQLLDGYRDDGQVVSSTFGSALSGDGNNMPECGLGGDPLPHGLSYEAQGARQSHGLSGIGGFGSQSGPLSLYALSRRIVKDLLGARTPFSFYVLRCILGQRGIRECPATTALFPIPLPVMDVWSGPRTLGVLRRRRLAQRRLLSLVIMALNYIHSPDPWKTFKILRRRPSKIHLDAHRRLLALVKAGGPSQAFDFLRCGRKSFQLSARLEEIFEALQKLGLSDSSKYHSSSSGASVSVRNDCDELVPYRPLSASRVKLTGQGAWDCSEFLSELFYLPFKEPRINMFDIQPPAGAFPDVRGSTGDEEFALALVWDAKNLLRLFQKIFAPKNSPATPVFLGTTKMLMQIGKLVTGVVKTFEKDVWLDPASRSLL